MNVNLIVNKYGFCLPMHFFLRMFACEACSGSPII